MEKIEARVISADYHLGHIYLKIPFYDVVE